MNPQDSKKLFIIQAPEYDKKFYEYFEQLCAQIEAHFNRILSFLKISTYKGEPIVIKLVVDVFNPEKISAYAERISKEPYVYRATMNAGISYRLWTVSRTFAIPDYDDVLPWIEECKINDERLKNLSKKDIIANYAFFIGCYYILLHEISHIVLGHVDYLKDEMNIGHLDEFQDEKQEYSSDKLRIRKAFEAEADRQAGQWLVGFFENSLGYNGLGGYLLFPSRMHAYEFYVCAIMAVFRLMQDLTQRKGLIHPKPNERLYILIGSLSEYFKQNLPHEHDAIFLHVVNSCLEAGEKFFVVDSFDPETVISNSHNLAFIDDLLKKANIRSYQHKFELVSPTK